MKKTLLAIVLAFVLVAFPLTAAPALGDDDKVTICHAAGQADTTHYETLTISRNAVFKEQGGHFYENGTPRAGHEQDYLGECKTYSHPTPTVTVSVPGPTVTVEVPGPTVTATVEVPGPTVTTQVPGPTVTSTATVTVPGPKETVAGPETKVEVPGPTVTATETEKVTVPGPTKTVTVTKTRVVTDEGNVLREDTVTRGGELAHTGGNSLTPWIAAIALALLAAGGTLVAASRSRLRRH